MADKDKQRLNLPLGGEKPASPRSGDLPEFPEDTTLEEKVLATLRTCYDPELPVNIVELGLIYELRVEEESGEVHVRMTLTTPNCPVAGSILSEVKRKAEAIPGVTRAEVELVWDPPWDPSRMTEAAQLELGLF